MRYVELVEGLKFDKNKINTLDDNLLDIKTDALMSLLGYNNDINLFINRFIRLKNSGEGEAVLSRDFDNSYLFINEIDYLDKKAIRASEIILDFINNETKLLKKKNIILNDSINEIKKILSKNILNFIIDKIEKDVLYTKKVIELENIDQSEEMENTINISLNQNKLIFEVVKSNIINMI